jgi:hypothetical protein
MKKLYVFGGLLTLLFFSLILKIDASSTFFGLRKIQSNIETELAEPSE